MARRPKRFRAPVIIAVTEFRAEWHRLARRCFCDALEGAEYRRVFRAWIDHGRRAPLGPFIKRLCGRPPQATRPSDGKPAAG
jgi:hypothetical protein